MGFKIESSNSSYAPNYGTTTYNDSSCAQSSVNPFKNYFDSTNESFYSQESESLQDALDFKKSLQDAQKLLHYTEDLNIEIIKQQ